MDAPSGLESWEITGNAVAANENMHAKQKRENLAGRAFMADTLTESLAGEKLLCIPWQTGQEKSAINTGGTTLRS